MTLVSEPVRFWPKVILAYMKTWLGDCGRPLWNSAL